MSPVLSAEHAGVGSGQQGLAKVGWGFRGLVVPLCHCGEGRREEQGEQG